MKSTKLSLKMVTSSLLSVSQAKRVRCSERSLDNPSLCNTVLLMMVAPGSLITTLWTFLLNSLILVTIFGPPTTEEQLIQTSILITLLMIRSSGISPWAIWPDLTFPLISNTFWLTPKATSLRLFGLVTLRAQLSGSSPMPLMLISPSTLKHSLDWLL